MQILLPVVTADFIGQCAALDEAIREAAVNFQFTYTARVPTWDNIYNVPDVVTELIKHYTLRGFLCKYDGDGGTLSISWIAPNMSYLEVSRITFSNPAMLPSLGVGFRAGMVYLCMTNGQDLRANSDLTMQRDLLPAIKQAATFGARQLTFGFAGCPSATVVALFKATFDMLTDQGFQITYNTTSGLFFLKWPDTFQINMYAGSLSQVVIQ